MRSILDENIIIWHLVLFEYFDERVFKVQIRSIHITLFCKVITPDPSVRLNVINNSLLYSVLQDTLKVCRLPLVLYCFQIKSICVLKGLLNKKTISMWISKYQTNSGGRNGNNN